ncbi:hypothetical protein G6F35_018331 [Rhizopus arrhizus]|nr:hypothetical protein G6F35_018331 [Rhizopus arrhizus]
MRESDTPYQVIIDIALTQGCDLIAMTSHGRSGMAALLPAGRYATAAAPWNVLGMPAAATPLRRVSCGKAPASSARAASNRPRSTPVR